MDKQAEQLKKLPQPLLDWYDQNRRILPWREEVSAYRTWISEIMLQQTRVAAATPYFARFMDAFPTVEALAAASEESLMRLWQGLGYYSRARNLQKAARIIVRDYGGIFPQTYKEIVGLPGIGDYTAGAILSIAFGQAVPAVDGNVLRVAARITGSEHNVLDGKTRALFRKWMAESMPTDRPGAFNQALMDLGAMICTPNGVPLCEDCPARNFCAAHAEGVEISLPIRIRKKEKRLEQLTVFVLRKGAKVALRQRPQQGLLAGLWEFPHVMGTLSEQQAAEQLTKWNLSAHQWDKRLSAVHEFTHIRWKMTGFVVQVDGGGEPDWVWCTEEELQRRAIPSAFAKFVQETGD